MLGPCSGGAQQLCSSILSLRMVCSRQICPVSIAMACLYHPARRAWSISDHAKRSKHFNQRIGSRAVDTFWTSMAQKRADHNLPIFEARAIWNGPMTPGTSKGVPRDHMEPTWCQYTHQKTVFPHLGPNRWETLEVIRLMWEGKFSQGWQKISTLSIEFLLK